MKTIVCFFSILIIGIAICLDPSYSQAAEYYVSTSYGSDTNPGTSNAPWKTISMANSNLKAGDIVYIMAGTYGETIRPLNSGVQEKYITYAAYDGQEVIIGGDIPNGADLSQRSWIKITGMTFTDTNGRWIEFQPSGSYNYIIDNTFEASSTSMSWSGIHLRDRADYNKIVGNIISTSCQPFDLIEIRVSSYNLIEDNYLGEAAHSALLMSGSAGRTEYNVIRNNTFQNRNHHNLAVGASADFSLVEGNKILDAGDKCSSDKCLENSCGQVRDRTEFTRDNHQAMKLVSRNCIVRNNVYINNGHFHLFSNVNGESVNNRVYNNTFYGNYIALRMHSYDGEPFSENIIKNNIFSASLDYNLLGTVTIKSNTNRLLNNRFYGDAMVSYKYSSGNDVSDVQSAYSTEWTGNITLDIDPGFDLKDIDSKEIFLRSDSVLIDAGSWLTVITSPDGYGTTFTVKDSRYFCDGFGIIAGDAIQLQNQKTVIRIKNIDYNSNKIVVDHSVSWKQGDGISLPYKGTAPDIGAIEYNNLTPPQLFIVKN